WDARTGELRARLISTFDGNWLAMTPDGLFAASGRGADQVLSLVRGFDVTTIGQVRQSLFNPDLVRVALAGDPDGQVREAAKVINLEKVVDSGPAPAVAITSHREGSQSSSELITMVARVTDMGKGIGRIEWRVNDITAAVTANPRVSERDYSVM